MGDVLRSLEKAKEGFVVSTCPRKLLFTGRAPCATLKKALIDELVQKVVCIQLMRRPVLFWVLGTSTRADTVDPFASSQCFMFGLAAGAAV